MGLEIGLFGAPRDNRFNNSLLIGLQEGLVVDRSLGLRSWIVGFGRNDGDDDVVGDDVGRRQTRVKKVGGEELVLKTCHGREGRRRKKKEERRIK